MNVLSRSQDVIARFIDEALELGAGWVTLSSILKTELKEWSQSQGLNLLIEAAYPLMSPRGSSFACANPVPVNSPDAITQPHARA